MRTAYPLSIYAIKNRKTLSSGHLVVPAADLLTDLSARIFDLGDTQTDLDEETAVLQNERESSVTEDGRTTVQERPRSRFLFF